MREFAGDPSHALIERDAWLRRTSIAGAVLFFFALISYNFVDIDIWHQMALIRESLRAGQLLRADPFAYTPTIKPWIDHEWGAGAVAYFSTLWLGGRALLILKFLLAAGTLAVCWRCATEVGSDFRITSFCAPLAIFLAYLGFFATIRAQVYSFFFTVVMVLFWQQDRRSRAWLIAWLVIFALWVNLHGGFVVGIGLTALYCVEQAMRGEEYKHLLLVSVAMMLEIFLTPYGSAYLRYLERALWMARPYAPEWRTAWDLGPAWVICFLLAVGIVIYALVSVGVRKMPGVLPLAAAAVEGALHRKLLPIFAVIWLCYAPFYLQRTSAGRWLLHFTERRRRFLITAWSTLAAVCVVSSVRQKPWELSVPQPIYPVGAVEYLSRQGFHGNVMVPFRVGAYVSWRLYPTVKVSLDGRYEEVFPDDVMRRVFDFYEARPDWRNTLEAYPTDVVLAPRASPVCDRMRESAWTAAYQDQDFVLYTKPGLSLPVEQDGGRSIAGVFP